MSFSKLIAEYNSKRPAGVNTTFCHAPTVNLNFDQNGNATACCYNRSFILGTYPKNTVSEICNGPKINELRELMKANDLSRGCGLCEHQLKARNFGGLHAIYYDKTATEALDAGIYGLKPAMIEFEISNTCNLECVMCNGFFSSSIRQNREKLEPMKNPYDLAFVEQLRPYLRTLRAAKFLGGEPFLNPLYYKIWEALAEENPSVTAVITTNGTIFNSKVKTVLKNLQPAIAFSCDSLDKKTYESIRVNADYDVMRENLETFIGLTQFTEKYMSLSVCPMRQNWKTIPDMLDFCNDRGVCLWFNTVFWPPEASLKNLKKLELARVRDFLGGRLNEALKESPYWWERENFNVYEGLLNQLSFWHEHANGA